MTQYEQYEHDVHYRMRGAIPPDPNAPKELTVRQLCNIFLAHKDDWPKWIERKEVTLHGSVGDWSISGP